MKAAFLVVFLPFLYSTCIVSVDVTKIAYAAINDILDNKLKIAAGEKLDIFWCGKKFGESENLVTQILRRQKFLHQLKTCDAKFVALDIPSLLVFESDEIFKQMSKKIVWQNNPEKRFEHLVYIFDSTQEFSSEIEEDDDWSFDNVAFLLNESQKSIDLATFFLFTDKKCRQNQLVTINRFRQGVLWENDNFWPKKYKNFFGCPMNLLYMSDEDKEDLFDFVVQQLSTIHRFQIRFRELHSRRKMLAARGKLKGDFFKTPQIIDNSTDNSLHILVITEIGVFVIPPGESLTAFEKLLSPFDFAAWIAIFSTLALSFTAIQIVGFGGKTFRNLCFGDNVVSPTMNMLSVFMCGGQTKVPKTTSARLIFLNFVIWSLVIRTCFQSLSYRALQMDLRHPPIQTINELIRSGFSQSMPWKFRRHYDGERYHGYLI